MSEYYIVNRETGKLELHFDKSTYAAMTDAQQQTLNGAYVWGGKSGCWISRAKEPNLWRAERIAQEMGFQSAGTTGERLSFAEQQARKAERAEARAARYETYASSAAGHAAELQKPINAMHGDIAFFTQPSINSSAGRAFTRRRDRMFAAFDRGFDELRRSAYWRERAEAARQTASNDKLQDRAFICRRISECESVLRKLKKFITEYETDKMPQAQAGTLKRYTGEPITVDDVQRQLDKWLDRMEAELDKLGYYQDALDALGGVAYSQDNIKPGYVVKVQQWGKVRVLSTGPKNFTANSGDGCTLTHSYAEIVEIVSAEEQAPQAHPFKVGDTFSLRDGSTHTIVKATAKTVMLQAGDGKPYRVSPKYRPIPIQRKMMWTLFVGGGWASEIFYRE